jgi:hypothetical protein
LDGVQRIQKSMVIKIFGLLRILGVQNGARLVILGFYVIKVNVESIHK